MKKSYFIRVPILALLTALFAGCASTDEINAIRALAEQAQADAQMAKDTANQAMSIAQATDERVNRMFKRSMLK